MTIHQSAPDAARRDDLEAASIAAAQDEIPQQLGYGHRAHRPDPEARYGFGPGEPRLLPVEERLRWRVPG
jgi:hypothetical protein